MRSSQTTGARQMNRAVGFSRRGMALGHGPFGAVVVRDGAVVGDGWNEVLRSKPGCSPEQFLEVLSFRRADGREGR